jgi:hypothetical protein
MSGDLASFVAATLRDKVIHELQDEIRLLNDKLRNVQKIEILSSCCAQCDHCEVTTYAIGYLEDGSYLPKRKLGIVPLNSIGCYGDCDDKNKKYNYDLCPLKQFHRLRVSIGGLHKTYLSLQNDGDSDGDGDDDVYNGVNCQFTGTGDTENSAGLAAKWGDIWIEFVIHGWPKEHYTTIIQKERDDQIIFGGESMSLLKYLKLVLPQLYPETAIEFIYISLDGYENKTIIKNFMPTSSSK